MGGGVTFPLCVLLLLFFVCCFFVHGGFLGFFFCYGVFEPFSIANINVNEYVHNAFLIIIIIIIINQSINQSINK